MLGSTVGWGRFGCAQKTQILLISKTCVLAAMRFVLPCQQLFLRRNLPSNVIMAHRYHGSYCNSDAECFSLERANFFL